MRKKGATMDFEPYDAVPRWSGTRLTETSNFSTPDRPGRYGMHDCRGRIAVHLPGSGNLRVPANLFRSRPGGEEFGPTVVHLRPSRVLSGGASRLCEPIRLGRRFA